jgi:uncharacterized protein (DUF1800 family)
MICSASRLIAKTVASGIMLVMCTLPAFMQSDPDPDPNSPSPVLLGIQKMPHRLPLAKGRLSRIDPSNESIRVTPSSRVVLLVTNVSLMQDEGAGAFRVYARDMEGRQYRFPVLDLQLYDASQGLYGLVVQLRDEIGYYDPPNPKSDLGILVSWRGNISNPLQLSNGKVVAMSGNQPAIGGKVPPAQSSKGTDADGPIKNYVGYKWSGDRMRFLEQATFGPTTALDSRIRRIGIRTWLAEQFDAPYPSASNPYPNLPLKPTTALSDCDGDNTGLNGNPIDVPVSCNRDTYTMYPIQTWFFREAFNGDAQLRHRIAWALAQIWVISGVETQQASWMITYHQQLSKNAFGNWRQLMSDVTLNPGMGDYLDMIRSTKTNPNENYPREVLQLFNVGLFMLNQDGTLQLDGQGNPIPTYDQTTINNFTKVFTGWRDCRTTGAACPNITLGSPDYKDPMELVTGNHDLTSKTLFNYPGSTTTNIAACSGCTGTAISTYAYNSLNQALDNIYNHPNVAPFVSKYLIQALVTSDPTPAYVGRISAVFSANRTNPSQMREVIRTILLDPEARGDVKTDPHYGKLREPVQLATNMMRQLNVTAQDGVNPSDGYVYNNVSNIGQNIFNSPTVFNFYPPDYVVPGTSLLGPEFFLFTTGTSIGRANLVNTFVMGNGVPVSNPTPPNAPNAPNGTKLNLTDVITYSAADATGNQMMDYLNTKMMHGTMSSQMRSTILTAVTAVASSNNTLRAQTALYLIVTSSQYQVQR